MKKITLVGMTRFELATPRPPAVCATRLRHIPISPLYTKNPLVSEGAFRPVLGGQHTLSSVQPRPF